MKVKTWIVIWLSLYYITKLVATKDLVCLTTALIIWMELFLTCNKNSWTLKTKKKKSEIWLMMPSSSNMEGHREMLKVRRPTSMVSLMTTPVIVVSSQVPTTLKIMINMVSKVPWIIKRKTTITQLKLDHSVFQEEGTSMMASLPQVPNLNNQKTSKN